MAKPSKDITLSLADGIAKKCIGLAYVKATFEGGQSMTNGDVSIMDSYMEEFF